MRAGRLRAGNTLRVLVKHLDSIPDDKIAEVDIPTGIPLVSGSAADLRPDALGGQYLDPHAARAAIATIRNEGQIARPDARHPTPATRRIRSGTASARPRIVVGSTASSHPRPRCGGPSTRRS